MPPKTHIPGHPCRGPPTQSMVICNYNNRDRNRKEMNTIANLVRTVSTGLILVNNNSALATKFGEPVLIGASENGAEPLVNENGSVGYHIDTTTINTDPPENMDTTKLGAMVARNSFAHVAGPLVKDSQGNINYNLLLRGYNKGGGSARDSNDYFGLDLMHDGTDAFMILSSGSTSATTDPSTPHKQTLVNYEEGETVRIRVSGVATDLADRSVTFEKRLTDSTEGGAAATWGPWFRLQ